jgi:hypothetical protein
MENNRIPFDIENWQSGQYEAVYNIGTKPLEILISKKAKDSPVLSVYPNGILLSHSENGVFDASNNAECIYNLFLTPKKKKGWVLVCKIIDEDVIFTDHSYSDEQHAEAKELFIKQGCKIIHESEFEY